MCVCVCLCVPCVRPAGRVSEPGSWPAAGGRSRMWSTGPQPQPVLECCIRKMRTSQMLIDLLYMSVWKSLQSAFYRLLSQVTEWTLPVSVVQSPLVGGTATPRNIVYTYVRGRVQHFWVLKLYNYPTSPSCVLFGGAQSSQLGGM